MKPVFERTITLENYSRARLNVGNLYIQKHHRYAGANVCIWIFAYDNLLIIETGLSSNDEIINDVTDYFINWHHNLMRRSYADHF